MRIMEVHPQNHHNLRIVADDGRVGIFDVSPYLKYEAFSSLKDQKNFVRILNGGYFIEWDCGADLSADTIEARWKMLEDKPLENNRSPLNVEGGFTIYSQFPISHQVFPMYFNPGDHQFILFWW